MPLPRRKDTGGSGAPVLNIPRAHVRLMDVEEHTAPYAVTRKSDGATFQFDPDFSCTVEIVDDGLDGSYNGVTFFERFRYKQDKDGSWFNQKNSRLGVLSEVVKPGYFDDTIPALEASDIEDFEMLCRIKPKKNPTTGAVIGSTIEWDTMQPLPKKPEGTAVVTEEETDYSDIPF